MKAWDYKTCSYKLSCGGLCLGFAQFVVGFGLPAWKRTPSATSGLWQNCSQGFGSCTSYSTHKLDDWFVAVRAVEAASLVSYCITLFIVCQLNCYTRSSPNCDRLALPAVSICTGTLGLVGVVLFAVFEADGYSSFSSALYLISVGSAFAFLCGILLLCHKGKMKVYGEGDRTGSVRELSHENPVFVDDRPPIASVGVFY